MQKEEEKENLYQIENDELEENLFLMDLFHKVYAQYLCLKVMDHPNSFNVLARAITIFRDCAGIAHHRSQEKILIKLLEKITKKIDSNNAVESMEHQDKQINEIQTAAANDKKSSSETTAAFVNSAAEKCPATPVSSTPQTCAAPPEIKSILRKNKKKRGAQKQKIHQDVQQQLKNTIKESGLTLSQHDEQTILQFMLDYLHPKDHLSSELLKQTKIILLQHLTTSSYKPWSSTLSFSNSVQIDFAKFIGITTALNQIFYDSKNSVQHSVSFQQT